ncbi:MAG: hypothetical protein ABEJ67_04490 [Halanaeroarchaeum sp.]
MTAATSHEKWARAADYRDESVDLDALLGRIGWTDTTDRTPYHNLLALVEALPEDTPDEVIEKIAFRRVTGFGPSSTRRALERAREEGDLP